MRKKCHWVSPGRKEKGVAREPAESDSESSDPVFTRSSPCFLPRYQTESYVVLSHRVLQSLAYRAHARRSRRRQKGKTSAPSLERGDTLFCTGKRNVLLLAAYFFCQSPESCLENVPFASPRFPQSIDPMPGPTQLVEYPRIPPRFAGIVANALTAPSRETKGSLAGPQTGPPLKNSANVDTYAFVTAFLYFAYGGLLADCHLEILEWAKENL